MEDFDMLLIVIMFGIDDFMAEGRTDENGQFKLSGIEYEISTIEPKLNIYHDCNDGWTPCQRKLSMLIPQLYVTIGAVPNNTYDIGNIELSGKNPGEERDCFNK
ncbi:hypothetical protein AB6A40_007025 [Gnathostoma spinigerum]|uniref:Transthyretin-like family protein n=1 Tax=Gnathostoma spinigerum TaxID=75299 RepID=A0ABD6EKM7_9BILA